MRGSQVGTAKPAEPPGILLAAIATIFGSPVIGAIILIESHWAGRADAAAVLPGLMSAGIGSVVFTGTGRVLRQPRFP